MKIDLNGITFDVIAGKKSISIKVANQDAIPIESGYLLKWHEILLVVMAQQIKENIFLVHFHDGSQREITSLTLDVGQVFLRNHDGLLREDRKVGHIGALVMFTLPHKMIKPASLTQQKRGSI